MVDPIEPSLPGTFVIPQFGSNIIAAPWMAWRKQDLRNHLWLLVLLVRIGFQKAGKEGISLNNFL